MKKLQKLIIPILLAITLGFATHAAGTMQEPTIANLQHEAKESDIDESVSSISREATPDVRPLLDKLYELKKQLPTRMRDLSPEYDNNPNAFFKILGSFFPICREIYYDYQPTMTDFTALYRSQMETPESWNNYIHPDLNSSLLNYPRKGKSPFTPFAQSLNVPENSTVLMWGDFHGGFHSLIATLKSLEQEGIIDTHLKIIKENHFMIFLGDFVDRGIYGVEVVYTLMKLKLANPRHVFLLRGNHEDILYNKSAIGNNEIGKFGNELTIKLQIQDDNDFDDMTSGFYNLLPLVLFLNKVMELSHGGLDMAYTPGSFLNAANDEKQENGEEQNLPSIKFDLFTQDNYNLVATTSQFDQKMLEDFVTALLHPVEKFSRDACHVITNTMMDTVNNYLTTYLTFKQLYQYFYQQKQNHDNVREEKDAGHVEETMVDPHNVEDRTKYIQKLIDAQSHFLSTFSQEKYMLFKSEHEKVVNKIGADYSLEKQFLQHYANENENIDAETYNKLLDLSLQITSQHKDVKKIFRDSHTIIMAYFSTQTIPELAKEMHANLKNDLMARLTNQTISPEIIEKIKYFSMSNGLCFLQNATNVPQCLGECGHAWAAPDRADILLDISSPGRPAYGKKITETIFQQKKILGKGRAHQHYGEMEKLLREHNGITVLWDFDNSQSIFNLQPGVVCTFQRAQSTLEQELPGNRVHYDTFGKLTVKGPFTEWTLEKRYILDPKLFSMPHGAQTIYMTDSISLTNRLKAHREQVAAFEAAQAANVALTQATPDESEAQVAYN